MKNGLRLITHTNKESKVTEIDVWIKAGGRYETNETWGYAHILEHMLLKGTEKYPDVFAVHSKLDRAGAYANAYTGVDQVRFVFQVAGKYTDSFLELMAEIIRRPLLDGDVFENEKKVVLEELHKTESTPDQFAARVNLNKVFQGHPLERYSLGTEESVRSATAEKIREYYKRFYAPNNAAIVVIGPDKHIAVKNIVEKYFGDWAKSDSLENNNQIPKHPQKRKFFHLNDIKQTYIFLNYYTPGADSTREQAALDLVASYLGYGFSSPLLQELRVKKGLVYNVSANNFFNADAGRFMLYTFTTKPKEVIVTFKEVVQKLKDRFSEGMLPEIKAQRVGQFLRVSADPFHEGDILGRNFILRNKLISPDDYVAEINKVTYTDIKNVIEKYLVEDNSFLTIVGPEDVAA